MHIRPGYVIKDLFYSERRCSGHADTQELRELLCPSDKRGYICCRCTNERCEVGRVRDVEDFLLSSDVDRRSKCAFFVVVNSVRVRNKLRVAKQLHLRQRTTKCICLHRLIDHPVHELREVLNRVLCLTVLRAFVLRNLLERSQLRVGASTLRKCQIVEVINPGERDVTYRILPHLGFGWRDAASLNHCVDHSEADLVQLLTHSLDERVRLESLLCCCSLLGSQEEVEPSGLRRVHQLIFAVRSQ